MPLTTSIFQMFARSPIRPLEQHIDKAFAAANALLPFITAVLKQDWALAEDIQRNIMELEGEADQIKKDLRLHLPKGLFLPVPRSDVLELLNVQDQIANKAKDIAGIIIGRKMRIPDPIANIFMDYLQCSIDACSQARHAINELDQLLEAGFSGNEVALVEEMIHRLDTIENESDQKQVAIRQQLYQLEASLPPIDAMFLYQAIEAIGKLADCAQTVGGHLQILLAH